MKPPFDIIVTAGPSLFPDGRLERMVELGATIVRLNGAHLDWERAGDLLSSLRARIGGARLLLDLSGRKVRLTGLERPIRFEAGGTFVLKRGNLNFPQVLDQVSAGDPVTALDGILSLEVVRASGETLELRSRTAGILSNGKGMHFRSAGIRLPPISSEEEARIRALGKGVDLFGLSFVHAPEDVDYVQGCLGDADTRRLLPKIETSRALEQAGEIAGRVDAVLIDRGDLASEIGMERSVEAVQAILKACKASGKRCYVATHFLRSMVENPVPTMSEIFDLHFMLSMGIDGIQFSDETAVGAHPEACMGFLVQALARRDA